MKLSAVFSDPYLADRAVARIRASGIIITKYDVAGSHIVSSDPALLVSYPYGQYYNTTPTINMANSLPETTGNAVMSKINTFGWEKAKAEISVSDKDWPRAKEILISAGALDIKTLL